MEQGKSRGMLCLPDLRHLHALGDHARVEHGEPVAQLQDRHQIVRDVEQRGSGTAVQIPQQPYNLSLSNRIQGAGRLVGYQNRGTMQKGQCNQHSLRLPNTDLAGLSAEKANVTGGQLHLVHQLVQARFQRFPSRRFVGAPGFLKMGSQRNGRVERGHGTLRNKSDLVPADLTRFAGAHSEQIASIDENFS